MTRGPWKVLVLIILALLLVALAEPAMAQAKGQETVRFSFGTGSNSEEGFALPIRILLFLTLLAVLPAILISMTSFVRIIVVMHFLRQAVGTQQVPNNQILVGISLFLTLFVMGPVWDQVYEQAVVPYQAGSLGDWEALQKAEVPVRGFMLKQVREKDLGLFVRLAKLPRPQTEADLPLRVIVPAFLISELKTAFQIGFVLYLPFLVIDMVISAVLLSMGMLQLPPIMISTPFKILLFILVDGWGLVVGSLVESFKV